MDQVTLSGSIKIHHPRHLIAAFQLNPATVSQKAHDELGRLEGPHA